MKTVNFKLDINKITQSINKITQNKNFSVVVMAGLFVLLLLDILFIFLPEIKAVKNLNSKIEAGMKKIDLGKSEVIDIKKLEAELENKSKELSFKENYFASEEDLALLLEEISKAASESKIKINQIKPIRETDASRIQKTKEETFVKVPILVQAVSDYHSLGKFINRLEKADKFLKVRELKMTADASDYEKSDVTMNIITILKARQ